MPLNPDDSYDDLAFILHHCAAAAVVTEKRFSGLRPRIPKETCWIEVDDESFGKPPFQNLSSGSVLSFWPDLSADDPALISYARGTSGQLKAVVLTHSNLLSNGSQMLLPFRFNETDRFSVFVAAAFPGNRDSPGVRAAGGRRMLRASANADRREWSRRYMRVRPRSWPERRNS